MGTVSSGVACGNFSGTEPDRRVALGVAAGVARMVGRVVGALVVALVVGLVVAGEVA
jgi:hypothetical protein